MHCVKPSPVDQKPMGHGAVAGFEGGTAHRERDFGA